ncbi:breast carcinoma-amplified sequence 3 homolog isoform X2 [Acanthaster planci]|uniref:Breast carcinoma-amplified sequence 3 homolog isoform X2 n=1 Tax=Acanthaster planci TaxID=133434 RepID=A0A8B7ZFV7_ACAPL|nr:breast carcinoma-amplified sequence 3 homolog isoform X2 [Acanthaster planci]
MAYQSPSKRPAASSRAAGVSVKAQPVSDKSYMATVVDFLQDAYSGNKAEDKDKILWVKFERMCSPRGHVSSPYYINQEGLEEPIFLAIGYTNGVQIWSIPPSGDAQEVLSLRQGPVRILRILPTPYVTAISNHQQDKRPLVALCDGASSSQPFCSVSLLSLKTGEQVHNISFKTPVCDVLGNRRLIVVALQEKVAAFDAVSFKSLFCITSCYPASSPNLNPLALGTRWLAYADRKLIPTHQSGGGVCRETSQSYKATVIHAAKAITKGITAFSESLGKLATSKLSTSPPRQESPVDKPSAAPLNIKHGTPGVVTIIDTGSVEGEFNVTEESSGDGIMAHFPAHINESISALAFDPSGTLLFTAGSQGHSFHIFRIMNHPCSSGLGAIHHLYTLYRGDTAAKVQDVSFTNDSRWVAVSTMRETTHVFPITPYGGPVSSRTHTPAKIVNKESRFHKSAGLDELVDTGRGSPVHGLSESPTSSGFHSPEPISSLGHSGALTSAAVSNPRLPPYPPPVTITPLVQIKQPAILASVGAVAGMTGSASRPRSASSQTAAVSDYVCISTCFASSRAHFVTSSKGTREKNDGSIKQTSVDSLFIMGCHGNLVEHYLEPKTLQTSGRKIEDNALELSVTEHAHWSLQRGMNWSERRPPLSGFNHLLITNDAKHTIANTAGSMLTSVPRSESSDSIRSAHSSPDSDFDEPWLSQVEMVTHAGPHRRLWMGPQFKFKTVPQPSSTTVLSSTSSALLSDGLETNRTAMEMTQDDLDLKPLRIQPLRSDPVPTPQLRSSEGSSQALASSQEASSLPTCIEYGSDANKASQRVKTKSLDGGAAKPDTMIDPETDRQAQTKGRRKKKKKGKIGVKERETAEVLWTKAECDPQETIETLNSPDKQELSRVESKGAFDQTVNLLEVSCGSWPENSYQRSSEVVEERLRQTIADAMAESPLMSHTQPSRHKEREVLLDHPDQLSSSAGSADSAVHSYEARGSPAHSMDHILVFPPASGSPDSN